MVEFRHLQNYAVEYKNQGLISRTLENNPELYGVAGVLATSATIRSALAYRKGVEWSSLGRKFLAYGGPEVVGMGILGYSSWSRSSKQAEAEKAGLELMPDRVITDMEAKFNPNRGTLLEVFPTTYDDGNKFAIGTRKYSLVDGTIFVHEGSDIKYDPRVTVNDRSDGKTSKSEAETKSKRGMGAREPIPVEASEVINRMGHFIKGAINDLENLEGADEKPDYSEIDDMLQFMTKYMNQTNNAPDPAARAAILNKVYGQIESNMGKDSLLSDHVSSATFRAFQEAYGDEVEETTSGEASTEEISSSSEPAPSRETKLKAGHGVSAKKLDDAVSAIEGKLKLIRSAAEAYEIIPTGSIFYDAGSTDRVKYNEVVASVLDHNSSPIRLQDDIALADQEDILREVIDSPVLDKETTRKGRRFNDLPTALYDLQQARKELDSSSHSGSTGSGPATKLEKYRNILADSGELSGTLLFDEYSIAQGQLRGWLRDEMAEDSPNIATVSFLDNLKEKPDTSDISATEAYAEDMEAYVKFANDTGLFAEMEPDKLKAMLGAFATNFANASK